MAQPFGVGDVVGGRYRITHHVVTSADQDIVFQASDEVRDRDVSILLASRSNAKQVATSARELATGARDSDVEVLDLGLAEERTYLISSLVDPNTLLDLVVPDTAPYVEPFFTDSLGSELFGQSRVMEPETYEDDAEYYAGLHAGSAPDHRAGEPARRFRRRRPAFLDKVSDSLNRRLGTENDAAALAVAAGQAEQARAAASAYLNRDMDVTAADPAADTEEAFTGTRDAATLTTDVAGADVPAAETSSFPAPSLQNHGALASEPASGQTSHEESAQAADAPSEERLDGDEVVDNPPDSPIDDYDEPPAPDVPDVSTQPPLPGPPRSRRLSDAVSFTGLIRPVPSLEKETAMRAPAARQAPAHTASAASHPEADRDDDAAPALMAGAAASGTAASSGEPADPVFADSEPADTEPADTEFTDKKPGIGRWITAAVLAAVLLVAAVVMFLNLRGGEPEDTVTEEEQGQDEDAEEAPAEDDTEGDPESDEGTSTEESAPAEDTGPEPEIADITRLVPDSPDLISDRDAQLANLFDGDTGTTWVTLSFATADFGGFSSGVGLVAELDETAEVSAVTINQQGESTGGAFEVLVNDSPSFEGAEQVGNGTLNWNETTVELENEGEAAYVIINITELPRQDAPNTDGLPFSTELAEITVD
ncbi:hypothetical protein [Nesterenkonia sp. CF4.4]|uniref:hypothetical protein n=1 Tax=Nesterenkonia sp. CF4.4 TaxID=3373079 RepID=UPI003EE44486